MTYILPGQSTVVSKAGRAVEVEATTGPTLGPPWQQAENGYFIRPSAAGEGVGELTVFRSMSRPRVLLGAEGVEAR